MSNSTTSKAELFIKQRLIRRLEQSVERPLVVSLKGDKAPLSSHSERDYARKLLDWLEINKEEWGEG